MQKVLNNHVYPVLKIRRIIRLVKKLSALYQNVTSHLLASRKVSYQNIRAAALSKARI